MSNKGVARKEGYGTGREWKHTQGTILNEKSRCNCLLLVLWLAVCENILCPLININRKLFTEFLEFQSSLQKFLDETIITQQKA